MLIRQIAPLSILAWLALVSIAAGQLPAKPPAVELPQAVKSASITLHVTDPLKQGANIAGVDVTMSAGAIRQHGTTGESGSFTGSGFKIGDKVDITYRFGGYVSDPTRTTTVAAQAQTRVEGTLVPSTATNTDARILIDWINRSAASKDTVQAKQEIYQFEWSRVQQLSPDVQRAVAAELKNGPGGEFLKTNASFAKMSAGGREP